MHTLRISVVPFLFVLLSTTVAFADDLTPDVSAFEPSYEPNLTCGSRIRLDYTSRLFKFSEVPSDDYQLYGFQKALRRLIRPTYKKAFKQTNRESYLTGHPVLDAKPEREISVSPFIYEIAVGDLEEAEPTQIGSRVTIFSIGPLTLYNDLQLDFNHDIAITLFGDLWEDETVYHEEIRTKTSPALLSIVASRRKNGNIYNDRFFSVDAKIGFRLRAKTDIISSVLSSMALRVSILIHGWDRKAFSKLDLRYEMDSIRDFELTASFSLVEH